MKKGIVHGVGINDYDGKIKVNGKPIHEYNLWTAMIQRCYSADYHTTRPTYTECFVEDYFLSFNNFLNYIRTVKGFDCYDDKGKRYQLDKDLLVKGNKQYSRGTICFIPSEINSFIGAHCTKTRGDLPMGVSWHNIGKKYLSKITIEGKQKSLGLYETPEEAFNVYKKEKLERVKYLANKYRSTISPQVYERLINYDIEIDY